MKGIALIDTELPEVCSTTFMGNGFLNDASKILFQLTAGFRWNNSSAGYAEAKGEKQETIQYDKCYRPCSQRPLLLGPGQQTIHDNTVSPHISRVC